jgi:hypothetical protein
MQMSQIDDMRIQRVLTFEGSIPDGYAFLVEGVIYVWNPNSHFQRLRLHDHVLVQAIREYLIARGRVFNTLQQAVQVVITEKWQNWEKLQTPYDE